MKQTFFLTVALTILIMAHGAEAARVCLTRTNETATCREIKSVMVINGQEQHNTGVACLQSDNSWKIVSGIGYGSSFFRNDNQPVAYVGPPILTDGGYQQQPTEIRYEVTRKSVCVPSMPVYLSDRPYYNGHWQRPPYPSPAPQPIPPVK